MIAIENPSLSLKSSGLKAYDDMEALSFMSMEGIPTTPAPQEPSIDTFEALTAMLKPILHSSLPWQLKRDQIINLLGRLDLSTSEVNKYTFWDAEKPYTRNLIATDNQTFTLLLLCWNPGKESKIHDHPCDGCFVKTLRGVLRESRYTVHQETNEIRRSAVKFYCENQVSLMSNDIGLHKIGNPNRDTGSVSLHLYTPPFNTCKVWKSEGTDVLDKAETASIGYFSVAGHRSPHLEGRPGTHARVMAQVLEAVRRCDSQEVQW